MNIKTGNPKQASYEVPTISELTGPLHEKLIHYFNETHEAVAHEDEDTLNELRGFVPELLQDFIDKESGLSENPAWLVNKMYAGWHVALGDFEQALQYEHAGFRAASGEPETEASKESRTKRISVSANNIADELRRLGRESEALPWAKSSVDLWPSNTVNQLVWSLVLYRVGMPDQANFIINELRKVASQHDVLSKCMSFERELQDMVDLPAVRRLFVDMHGDPSINSKEAL